MSTGINGQFGLAAESTYGTAVTVTEFFPIISENLKETIARIDDDTQIAGRRMRDSTQWGPGAVSVAGSVQTLLFKTGTRTLLEHMIGTEAGAGPYTYTPGSLVGDSMTMQVGRPSTDGTVNPFTFAGMKVASWEIAAAEGQSVTLGLDCIGQSMTTATALATASYGSLVPFRYVDASLTIAGSAYKVKQLRLSGNNMLTERRFDGQNTTEEPLEEDLRDYGGSFSSEFIDLTQVNRFRNGDEAAFVVTFSNGAQSLVFTMNCRFDDGNPALAGRGILDLDVPFVCVDSTDASAFTATLTLT